MTPADNIPFPIRVFPRRTRATPIDNRAFVGTPPLGLTPADVQEVHVSCTFTWDKRECERLVREWQFIYPDAKVRVGGPAYGDAGGEFVPGMYMAPGHVFTSRGCPNHCDKCKVPEREGPLRLLPIRDGWKVEDNNFLACPRDHREAVFEMLRRQPERPRFTGGLEAARFTREIAVEILSLKPAVLFFAYDRAAEQAAVDRAFGLIYDLTGWSAGTFRNRVSCYALCGYEGDTIEAAEARIAWLIRRGARAYPMYFRDDNYRGMAPGWHDLIGGTMAFGGKR